MKKAKLKKKIKQQQTTIESMASWMNGAIVAVELFDTKSPSQTKWRNEMVASARTMLMEYAASEKI